MASAAVTFEAVAAAAAGVQASGQPVTIEAVSAALDAPATIAVHQHLAAWRSTQPPAPVPAPELPADVLAALTGWARRYADEAGAASRAGLAQTSSDLDALLDASAGLEAERDAVTAARDEALEILAERDETIERLQAELRNARQIATDALVGKAKDQLAIEGKDSQLADLRQQLERNVAAAAADSDRRLAAEMELVGAITARDNFAAEIQELRARLDARQVRGAG
ncbi:hypothetical protein ASF61_12565 [Duganella sp. Leaf126]|uniref:DNA-binding protein n=1 Tax=Duganella sp. Leaf126 TaxID=1736266 RepID=UPI0006FE08F8|nr:DNA-binding protein [Duganella sp. Leaf126]KQQ32924.1 hypothetical protein ASF61_12565 [Duganella sp. Leaf126]